MKPFTVLAVLAMLSQTGCGKPGLTGEYHDSKNIFHLAFTQDGQFSGSIQAPTFHGFKGTYTMSGTHVTLKLTEEDGKAPSAHDAAPQNLTVSDDHTLSTPDGQTLTRL